MHPSTGARALLGAIYRDGSSLFTWYAPTLSLAGLTNLSSLDNPNCISIISNVHGFQSWLSIRTAPDSSPLEAKRTLVRWCGGDRWECDFRCPKGQQSSTTCLHRRRAREYLMEVMWGGEDWADVPVEADELGHMGTPSLPV